MLLTDGNPNTSAGLVVYETEILDVASTEGIDLDQKLTLATEEISQDVLNVLLDHTRMTDPVASAMAGPNARRTIGVSDVVVSARMTRWHALHTLAVTYRDAFNNQLNDRYRAKWKEYTLLAQGARTTAYGFGIGIVAGPVPQAQPAVLSIASGDGQGGTFYVQTTWVNANGSEGAPSIETALTVAAQNDLVVTPVNPPAVASGFNVYIGASSGGETLQNSAPVPVGGSFTMPDTGVALGTPVGTGQVASYYVTGAGLEAGVSDGANGEHRDGDFHGVSDGPGYGGWTGDRAVVDEHGDQARGDRGCAGGQPKRVGGDFGAGARFDLSDGECVLRSREEFINGEIPDIFREDTDDRGSAGVPGSDRGARGSDAVVCGRGDTGVGFESWELGAGRVFYRRI
jgi:hypothetical protein